MVADQNLSFEFPTSEGFQAYAHFMRPDAAENLPASSTTLRWTRASLFRVQAHRDPGPDRHSMHADTLEAVEGLKSFNRRRRL
jgi:hypothetical protein